MSVKKLLSNCRTIHQFLNKPIEEKFIIEALENSLQAPNHKFTFPWKYYWVDGEAKKKIAQLNLLLKEEKLGELEKEEKEKNLNKVLFPELIVFSQIKNEDDFTAKEDYATLCCSVQLFALTLAQNNVGYKWGTGKVTRDKRCYEILKINPEKEEIIGFIFAGYPSKKIPPKRRPTLSDVLVRCK